ncbi:ee47fec8-2b5c-461b-99d7-7d4e1bf5162c [Thermothielavioides terrestris]|uniref:Ee47fec8-2b5c-461b-99d7-7d4e1bf5162c n=1 Tax=Thermothielavioides terrestris TaxID=2587410 RepID=A0A3S5CVV7_9PEZI|nr:ee47fec8-2b5c-461b-99d7-7d4e1bf5162c [Thermothielavioides terrestris]
MDVFDTSKPDRFQQSLSSAWASFLSAQHCGREVDALKKALDAHTQQTTVSIANLQREAASRHDLINTAVAECKSQLEQHAARLQDTCALQARLDAVQQDIARGREDASKTITELSRTVDALREKLEQLQSVTALDIPALQEQCRAALERVEFLEGELRELRAEKTASEQRLAALEKQLATGNDNRQELPKATVSFLDEVLARRDELMRLLDSQQLPIPSESSSDTSRSTSLEEFQTAAPTAPNQPDKTVVSQLSAQPTVNPAESGSQPQPNHPAPGSSSNPNQDIRSLYLVFRDRYKTSPPKSDTAFIWDFLDSIESPALSKHIQESLAALLPEHVARSRDTRRKNPRRLVMLSKGLTWRRFREALVQIPGPSS